MDPLPSDQMDCDTFALLELPQLVLVGVLGNLSARELAHASESCHTLYRICQHNGVWKKVAKHTWGIKPSRGIVRPSRWKSYYAQRLVVLREGSFKWHQPKATGDVISKRYQHTGSVVGNDIYYIGGQELPERRFDDIYVLHTDTMEVKKIDPIGGCPPKFARHSAVTVGTNIYLFGGFDGRSNHYHLNVFDTLTHRWSTPLVAGDCPPSRTNHSAVAVGSRMYIFGGMYKRSSAHAESLVFLNDMYALETQGTLRWSRVNQLGEVPSPRCGHRIVAFGSILVLFGGGSGEQWDRKFSDVFVFDTTTCTWTRPKIQGTAPVCTFTVTFATGVFLFVFGGQSLHDNNLTNDLYCLDTITMSWAKLTASNQYPGARDMASGNVVGNSMYMFGGYCGAAIDTFFKLQMDPEIMAASSSTMPPRA